MDTKAEELETALRSLTLSGTDKTNDSNAIAILAYASKHKESARHRLADPAALRTLVEVVECSINDSLETLELALRCIANACADNNAARDAITDLGFSWALQCLHLTDTELQILTTKVLYNICAGDHEASQRKCYETGIHFVLVSICAKSGNIEECSFALELLLWICGQKTAADPALNRPVSDDSLHELLFLPSLFANNSDLETFASIIETVLVFIRDPIVQTRIAKTKQLGKVWRILELQQTKAAAIDAESEEGKEDLKLVLALSMSLVWCLSDTAALPDFAKTYSLDGPEVKAVISYIQARGGVVESRGDSNGLQLTAACQTVGNLLWALPIETYASLVISDQLHRPLLEIIIRTGLAKEDAGVLHSIAGLLIQLSRPSVEVRDTIGSDELAPEALERLCRHEMSNVQQEGVKLLRALGRECSANQQRFANLAKEALITASQDSNAQAGAMAQIGATQPS